MDHTQQEQELHGLLSCWGMLRLPSLWQSLRRRCRIRFRRDRSGVRRGSFRYDPLSYARNFDEGCQEDDEEENDRCVFSSRFAALHPPQALPMSASSAWGLLSSMERRPAISFPMAVDGTIYTVWIATWIWDMNSYELYYFLSTLIHVWYSFVSNSKCLLLYVGIVIL